MRDRQRAGTASRWFPSIPPRLIRRGAAAEHPKSRVQGQQIARFRVGVAGGSESVAAGWSMCLPPCAFLDDRDLDGAGTAFG